MGYVLNHEQIKYDCASTSGRVLAVTYLIASGLTGEPVPPVITRGGAQKKNSNMRSAAQSAASSATSNISPIVSPIAGITTQCQGCCASGVSLGRTSTPQVSEQIAATSLSWHQKQFSNLTPGASPPA